jgi:hypothetical protein
MVLSVYFERAAIKSAFFIEEIPSIPFFLAASFNSATVSLL